MLLSSAESFLKQTVGLPMGINCVQLLAGFLCTCMRLSSFWNVLKEENKIRPVSLISHAGK